MAREGVYARMSRLNYASFDDVPMDEVVKQAADKAAMVT